MTDGGWPTPAVVPRSYSADHSSASRATARRTMRLSRRGSSSGDRPLWRITSTTTSRISRRSWIAAIIAQLCKRTLLGLQVDLPDRDADLARDQGSVTQHEVGAAQDHRLGGIAAAHDDSAAARQHDADQPAWIAGLQREGDEAQAED